MANKRPKFDISGGYYAPIPGSSTGINIRYKKPKYVPRPGRISRGRGRGEEERERLSRREALTRLGVSGKVDVSSPEFKRGILGQGPGEEDIPFSETSVGVGRTMRTRGLVKVGGDWVTRGARRKFAGERTQRQLATRTRERARGLDVRSVHYPTSGITLRGEETEQYSTLQPESLGRVRKALLAERMRTGQEDIDIRKEIMEGDTAKRERVSAAHAASGYEVPKGYPQPPAKEPIMGYGAYQKALAPQAAAAPAPSPQPAAQAGGRPIPDEDWFRQVASQGQSPEYIQAYREGRMPPPSPPRPVMPPELVALYGPADPPPVLPSLPAQAAPTAAAPTAAAPTGLTPEQQESIRREVDEHMRTRFRSAAPGAPVTEQPGGMNLAAANRILGQPLQYPTAVPPTVGGGGFAAPPLTPEQQIQAMALEEMRGQTRSRGTVRAAAGQGADVQNEANTLVADIGADIGSQSWDMEDSAMMNFEVEQAGRFFDRAIVGKTPIQQQMIAQAIVRSSWFQDMHSRTGGLLSAESIIPSWAKDAQQLGRTIQQFVRKIDALASQVDPNVVRAQQFLQPAVPPEAQ